MGRVFANGSEDLGSIVLHVIPKTLKMVLNTSLLYTQHIKYVSKLIKLATLAEGGAKAPFSIATTPRIREGHYSFPWIAILYP